MKLQVVQDGKGNNTGVFIPMEDWNLIKNQYPDIENVGKELDEFEKELIDTRLESIAKKTNRLKDGKNLIQVLKNKI